jgi:hypothetical protein
MPLHFSVIGVSGMAGMSKERELPDGQKKATVRQFSILKGILVAISLYDLRLGVFHQS